MQRSIAVSLLPGLSSSQRLSTQKQAEQTCSVVIDVLRASSVMVTAGNAGVSDIKTCGEISEAEAVADSCDSRPLLCGERECKPIEGFDLGNSPAEYTSGRVGGRSMILTTTNGTRAIRSVVHSQRLLVAAFLNLDSTVQAIEDEPELHLVCSGTDGQVSYEDVLLAGAIIARLNPEGMRDQLDDSARLAWEGWMRLQDSSDSLVDGLRRSLGGRNLIRVGYEDDIERCAKCDVVSGIIERVSAGEPVFEYRS